MVEFVVLLELEIAPELVARLELDELDNELLELRELELLPKLDEDTLLEEDVPVVAELFAIALELVATELFAFALEDIAAELEMALESLRDSTF